MTSRDLGQRAASVAGVRQCPRRYHTDTEVVTDAIAREIDPTKPLGIDTVMRSGFLMPLMERHAASEFFLGDFAVTAARTYKDAAEQELMRASSAANDA